jgi:uncharacterized SAM-binding protein YcdF (DUF218 family)
VFVLAKLMDLLTVPANVLLLVLLAASLLWTRRPVASRRVVRASAGVLLALAVLPWDAWLVTPLEDRFPQPVALPEHVDGIIVLGGAIDPVLSTARGQPSLNGAAERVTAFLALARRYPGARLIYSGGSGSVTMQQLKEAPVARELLDELGFDTKRVMFEGQSRNTWENAVYARQLANPAPKETWLLVTSATHMPRAVGAFRAAGWSVLPYPVDYQTPGSGAKLRFNADGGLSTVATAMHEWLGLVYYRWRGWSDALYPAPAAHL